MNTWISLLRGINVGGKNILPMKELRSLLEGLGYADVKTYIQSGNCVFQSNKRASSVISTEIANSIESVFGFKPAIRTLSKSLKNLSLRYLSLTNLQVLVVS